MRIERSLPLPESSLTNLGSFTADNDLAVGAWGEKIIGNSAGEWNVQFCELDDFDAVLDEVTEPQELYAQQLVLSKTGHDHVDLAAPQLLCTLAVDGARFAVLDSAMVSRYEQARLFDELLDGVHGILDGQVGTQVYLDGDGHANVWLAIHDGTPAMMQIDLW